MQTESSSTKALPPMIICECGQMLSRMVIEDSFGKSVECDNCLKLINLTSFAYHCINGHCFCLKCSNSLLLSVDNPSLLKPIHCACQQIMILTQPNEAYNSASAYCNNTVCRAKIGKMEYVCFCN